MSPASRGRAPDGGLVSHLRAILARARGLFAGRRSEDELEEELQAHLRMHIEENLRRGMTLDAARRDALLAAGGLELAKDAVREQRGLPWIETTIADVRYAIRTLRKTPGFAAVVILTLSLGIGGMTAVFSVVNGVLLRPLPYAEPNRLVALSTISEGEVGPISEADLVDWRTRVRTLDGVAAGFSSRTMLTGSGDPAWLSQSRITANTLAVLGLSPLLGRDFRAGEDLESGPRIALLAESVWRSRFAADSSLVGRTILLDGFATTVVGIAPAEMRWPIAAEVFLPTRFDPDDFGEAARGSRWLDAVGRLADDASLEAARAEMHGVAVGLAETHPEENAGVDILVTPLLDSLVADVSWTLLLLLGAVALVLLIACANVAALTFGRVTVREGELSMRRALGASRARIARQLLTESLLVATAGGTLGILLALLGTKALLGMAPADLPRLADVALDRYVLAFALASTLGAGVLFGIAPALQRPDTDLHSRSRPAGRGAISLGITARSRRALVVVQVALAVVLMSGAGLLMRSFLVVRSVDPGFRPEGIATFGVAVPPHRKQPGSDDAFVDDLLDGLRNMPGVSSAAVALYVPLAGAGFPSAISIAGREERPGRDEPAELQIVSPEYFTVMEIPLVRGRVFDRRDVAGADQKVIISEELARRYLPTEDPIGKTIQTGFRIVSCEAPRGCIETRFGGEVIGVVADVRQYALTRGAAAHIYMPFAQFPRNEFEVVVRSDLDVAVTLSEARSVLRRVDANTPMDQPRSYEALVDASLGSRRFQLELLSAFAAVAMVLAGVGVYGVIAYGVQQRRGEIGVRLALGASRKRVLGMVIGEGLALVGTGAAIGVAIASLLSGALESFLFQVGKHDLVTFALTPAVLMLVAVAACAFPATRAAMTDPVQTIREE